MKRFSEWQYFHLEMNLEDVDMNYEQRLDMMTWRRWLNNALNRAHGIFGEALEYTILNQDRATAYIRVSFHDREFFSTAVSTYISSDEIAGVPAAVHIQQETSNLKSLKVNDGDSIWYRRALEDEMENANVSSV